MSTQMLSNKRPKKDLVELPGPLESECPLRFIKISQEMLKTFDDCRDKLLEEFMKLNPNYRYKGRDFDRCINCWLRILYD